jgi:hypothetical protein
MFHELQRVVIWFTRSRARTAAVPSEPAVMSPFAFEFDPMWHGDHWQNLLSSPMDARRYVMEDWSVPSKMDWSDVDGTAAAH